MASNFYWLNGNYIEKEKCFLHVSDLSIQRSFAVFDYFIFIDNVPIYIDDYLARFRNSIKVMNIEFLLNDDEIKDVVIELIRRNGISKGGIKFIFTGGYAENGYDAQIPNFLIMHMPFPTISDIHYENGIYLLLEEFQRDFPTVKTTDYFFVLSIKEKIKKAGAYDVLYHMDGLISESSRSNFFVVDHDNNICTTEKGILMGVTRKNLLKSIEGQYNIIERPIYSSELNNIKEAFLTSSVKRVIPITKIGDYTIGTGKPGDVTKRIMSILSKSDKDYITNFNNI